MFLEDASAVFCTASYQSIQKIYHATVPPCRGMTGTIVSRHRLCEDEAGRLSIDKAEDLVASAVSWPSVRHVMGIEQPSPFWGKHLRVKPKHLRLYPWGNVLWFFPEEMVSLRGYPYKRYSVFFPMNKIYYSQCLELVYEVMSTFTSFDKFCIISIWFKSTHYISLHFYSFVFPSYGFRYDLGVLGHPYLSGIPQARLSGKQKRTVAWGPSCHGLERTPITRLLL